MEEENAKEIHHLKDLRENTFLDLIAAKNQDKRFYGWLHMHPLFDDDQEWDNQFSSQNKTGQNRRLSEQIDLKNRNLLSKGKDDDIEFFQDLYGGISTLFNIEEENVDATVKPKAYGFLDGLK